MGTMAEGAAARKVIIIGAGFAGLAAARRVAFRGAGRWQATILEGSHRVGGRAHTAEVSSCPVRGVSARHPGDVACPDTANA
jgi:monoamine oxidase